VAEELEERTISKIPEKGAGTVVEIEGAERCAGGRWRKTESLWEIRPPERHYRARHQRGVGVATRGGKSKITNQRGRSPKSTKTSRKKK